MIFEQGPISTESPEFEAAENNARETMNQLINNKGTKPVDYFHKRLGKIMWNKCGMSRNKKELKEKHQRDLSIKSWFYNGRCSSTWIFRRI